MISAGSFSQAPALLGNGFYFPPNSDDFYSSRTAWGSDGATPESVTDRAKGGNSPLPLSQQPPSTGFRRCGQPHSLTADWQWGLLPRNDWLTGESHFRTFALLCIAHKGFCQNGLDKRLVCEILVCMKSNIQATTDHKKVRGWGCWMSKGQVPKREGLSSVWGRGQAWRLASLLNIYTFWKKKGTAEKERRHWTYSEGSICSTGAMDQSLWEGRQGGKQELGHLEGTWFEDTVGCQQVLVQRLEREMWI